MGEEGVAGLELAQNSAESAALTRASPPPEDGSLPRFEEVGARFPSVNAFWSIIIENPFFPCGHRRFNDEIIVK